MSMPAAAVSAEEETPPATAAPTTATTSAATSTTTAATSPATVPEPFSSAATKRWVTLALSLISVRTVALVLAILATIGALSVRAWRRRKASPPTAQEASAAQPPKLSDALTVVGLLALVAAVLAAHAMGVSFAVDLGKVLTEHPWPIVIVVLALLFRTEAGQVVTTLAKRFQAGTVDLHLGQFQVKLEEPPGPEGGPPTLPFSRSPFEIEPGAVVDESRIRFELRRQIVLHVTDYIAQLWGRTHPADVGALTQARTDLERACQAGAAAAVLTTALAHYTTALERCRFLQANALVRLRNRYGVLHGVLQGVDARRNDPGLSAADCRLLHCVGVGLALEGDWSGARDLLGQLLDVRSYLPAADTFVVCLYNAHIEEAGEDIEQDAFLRWVTDQWESRAHRLRDRCEAANWTVQFPAAPKAFHMRELYKTLGGIYTLVADNLPGQDQERLFSQAERYLLQCLAPIDGEAGSPLDYNNLADLCRKRRRLEGEEGATRRLDRAFELSAGVPNPLFFYTRAEILRAQGELWKGVEVLFTYTEDMARQGGGFEIRQFLHNQIFAAKLVVEDQQLGNARLAFAVDILKRAERFLEHERTRLDEHHYRELECEIEELLGFAYLELSECAKAIAALRRAVAAHGPERSAAQLRRTLALARAHVQLARSLRQKLAGSEATRQRQEAETRLHQVATIMAKLPQPKVPTPKRREERFRLRFDVLVANQELAEECFYQGAFEAAQTRLGEVVEPLWDELDKFVGDDAGKEALGDSLPEMRNRLALYRACRQFLAARLWIRLEPEGVERIRSTLSQARGVDGLLAPWVDLELGSFLLAAAAKKPNEPTLYQDAIASLQSAAAADQPIPRREAVRLLSVAYVQRAAAGTARRSSQPAA